MWEGSTKIILKDTKTGKEEIRESKNVFKADNIASFCRSLGYYNSNIFNHSNVTNRPIWQTLVGGLFLFDSEVDTDAFMMPAGVKMIGNGSYGVYNNGSPREMGSWNDTESSASEDEIKLVWDFTTSQANGQIKSVCLTSDLGGYIGMGNPSGDVSSTKKALSNYVYTTANKTGRVALSGKKSILATHTRGTYSILRALNSGKIGYTVTSTYMDNIDLYARYDETVEIDAPDRDTAYDYPVITCTTYDDKEIIVVNSGSSHSSISAGGTFDVIVVNPLDGTCTKKTLTNITGETILCTLSSDSPYAIYPINENEYIMGGSGKLFYVNYLKNESTEIFSAYWAIDLDKITPLNDDLIYIRPFSSSNIYLFDKINMTLYPVNLTAKPTGYNSTQKVFTSSFFESAITYANPLYLATINNITPVTKSDTQSMKVIYTLNKAS